MDQNLDELELFSNDIVKNEVVDSEEGQKTLIAGRGDKWLVKEEEPQRRRLTSAMETNNYITKKRLNAEIKEEADAVQLESDPVGCSLPVAEEKSVRGSFNAHDFFFIEAAAKEEEEDEVLDESMNQATIEKSCPVDGCFEKLPSLPDLVEHIKTHPTPVVCGFCKKSFAQPSLLRKHYATHTGEKNFECYLCDYKAARPNTLKTHLRNHEVERPYPCTFCDKSFANSSILTTHLRTHTGERPFVCEICGFRTTQGSSLKTHQRTHTGEAPYPAVT